MTNHAPCLSVIDRFINRRSPPLEHRLELLPGTIKDYDRLSEHHYKANRPATVTRVLVLAHHHPTPAARFLGRESERQVVAVLVESLPRLNGRMRDHSLANRYNSVRDIPQRARLLTDEIRCISRVVVDPRWRGLGLAVRLVRESLQTAQTIYTEALAAMGRVHPFFTLAGMTAYPRHAHEHDARLMAAFHSAGFQAGHLAFPDRVLESVRSKSPEESAWLLHEIARWHRRTHGRARTHDPNPVEQLKMAQQHLLCEPVYYLSDNRKQSRGPTVPVLNNRSSAGPSGNL